MLPTLKKQNLRFLIWAALLVVVYLAALHPATGIFGGYLILLAGWCIPTVVNILLAAWCTSLVVMRPWVRIGTFVFLSFLLGVNTALPRLVKASFNKTAATSTIYQSVVVDADTTVDFSGPSVSDPNLELRGVIADPLSSPVIVGGDEGCGCMYFTFNDKASYFEKAKELVAERTGFHNFDHKGHHLHFAIKFSKKDSPDISDFSLTVYDGDRKTASFVQEDVPLDATLKYRMSGRGLLNGHFLENSLSVLLHENAWTVLLRNTASYVPRKSLRDFLIKAVQIA